MRLHAVTALALVTAYGFTAYGFTAYGMLRRCTLDLNIAFLRCARCAAAVADVLF
jgi:hypothetical protein